MNLIEEIKKSNAEKERKGKQKKKKRMIPAAHVKTTVNRFFSFPVARI